MQKRLCSSQLLDASGRFISTLALKVKLYQVESEAEDILQLLISSWTPEESSHYKLVWVSDEEDRKTRIS